MINDNIKKYRTEKGYSQEELAVRLHVVRQTVSKWEKGMSVPDAEVLIDMANVLGVPVSKLLGVEVNQNEIDGMTEELSRLNELLAKKNQKESLLKRANEKRGIILLLTFVSMMVMLGVKNSVISVILSGGCILIAVIILYRNLALLTRVTTEDMRLKVLRVTTVFNIGLLLLVIIMAILTATDVIQFSENGEKMFAMFIVVAIMIFAGIVSPKLPFTRHTGLRLPWTVQDEDTWNLAHRIIGYISLPLSLLYAACSLTIDYFEQVSLAVILLWIGIPGVISFVFFWKKTHGRL